MLHFRDSGEEIENDGFDKDFNKEMLWFSSAGRMLVSRILVRRLENYVFDKDFKDSGQEIQNDGFDKEFVKKCYRFEALDECWISVISWIWSGDRKLWF